MALIGWWPLDGNTEDYTVNKNNGVNNGVTWTDGKIGQAGNFNGTNSRVIIDNKDTLNPLKTLSIATWVYIPEYPTSERNFVDKNGYNQYRFGIWGTGDGRLHATIQVTNGTSSTWVNGFGSKDRYALPLNQWVHLVYTVNLNSKEISLFVNGNHYDTLYITSISGDLEMIPSSNNVFLGYYTTGNTYLNGSLNDVRIYDHALSQKEINDLAKAKVLHYTFNKDEDVAYDGSGFKNNGILINNPLFESDTKIGSRAIKLNPGNVTINPDPLLESILTSEYTISLWTKGTINVPEFSYIVHKSTTGNSSIAGSLLYIGTTNEGKFSFGINGQWSVGTTDIIQDPNTWYHLVLRYSGTTVTGFINGVQKTSYTSGYSNPIVGSYIVLGDSSLSFSARRYNGLISDFEIYSYALSDSEVIHLYQTRAKIDNQGNLYANEIVEDYEIQPGLTLRGLFEDNNLIDNYDLSNTTGWFSYSNWTTFTSQNGYMRATDSTTSGRIYFGTTLNTTADTNDKIYFTTRVRASFIDSAEPIKLNTVIGANNLGSANIELTNDFEQRSGIITSSFLAGSPISSQATGIEFSTNYNASTIGEYIDVDNFHAINLSQLTREGYFITEPTQIEVDNWFRDYITSRPKSSGIIKTREFSEIDTPNEPMKIFKDKIQIQGSIKEG